MAVYKTCHTALLKEHHTEKGVALSQIMASLQTDLNFSSGNNGRTIPSKNYSWHSSWHRSSYAIH